MLTCYERRELVLFNPPLPQSDVRIVAEAPGDLLDELARELAINGGFYEELAAWYPWRQYETLPLTKWPDEQQLLMLMEFGTYLAGLIQRRRFDLWASRAGCGLRLAISAYGMTLVWEWEKQRRYS